MARLEVRRRYTWTIFQSIEYAGEQDQVKVSTMTVRRETRIGGGAKYELLSGVDSRRINFVLSGELQLPPPDFKRNYSPSRFRPLGDGGGF
jgi:hypothetical protein